MNPSTFVNNDRTGFKTLGLSKRDGLVVRTSASQSVDLGFISLVES